MFARFTLEIELGNDAMRTGDDMAAALRGVAAELEHALGSSPMEPGARGVRVGIRDLNGNTVGHWQLEEVNDGD